LTHPQENPANTAKMIHGLPFIYFMTTAMTNTNTESAIQEALMPQANPAPQASANGTAGHLTVEPIPLRV
jgi:hypothetical protein